MTAGRIPIAGGGVDVLNDGDGISAGKRGRATPSGAYDVIFFGHITAAVEFGTKADFVVMRTPQRSLAVM